MEKTKFFYSDSNDNFRSSPPTEYALWKFTNIYGYENAFERLLKLLYKPSGLEVLLMFDYKQIISLDDIQEQFGWGYIYVRRFMNELCEIGLLKQLNTREWSLI